MVLGKGRANAELPQGSGSTGISWLLLLARIWQAGDKILNKNLNLILERDVVRKSESSGLDKLSDATIGQNPITPVAWCWGWSWLGSKAHLHPQRAVPVPPLHSGMANTSGLNWWVWDSTNPVSSAAACLYSADRLLRACSFCFGGKCRFYYKI